MEWVVQRFHENLLRYSPETVQVHRTQKVITKISDSKNIHICINALYEVALITLEGGEFHEKLDLIKMNVYGH